MTFIVCVFPQVVEMYSSGGDLHLELPTGEKEAPRNLWVRPNIWHQRPFSVCGGASSQPIKSEGMLHM